jgi:hypothetical protein
MIRKLSHLLVIVLMLLCCFVSFSFGAGLLFPFGYPARDTAGVPAEQFADRHATDKMIYYDYYAGDEPAGPINFCRSKSQFYSQTTLAGFWSVFDSHMTSYYRNSIVDGEMYRYPKRNARMKNSRHLDRMLLAYNTDKDFIFFVDSLISPQVAQLINPDSLAVEACAKYVLTCDTVMRNRYDIPTGGYNDSLILHQLGQEFNGQALVAHGTSFWMRRTNGDTLAAYKLAATIINAISAKLHSYKGNAYTTLEMFYPEGAKDGYYGIDTTWVDSVLARTTNLNAIFFVVQPGERPSQLTQINNSTTKLGSRKLGIRFSWANMPANPQLSHSTQVELLRDLDYYVPNKKYISIYADNALSGKWSGYFQNSDQHWQALAARQAKPWLVFVDQFEEVGLDTDLWNQDGTSYVTQEPNNGYIRIGRSSHIRNDSTYTKLSKVVCKLDTGGEGTASSQDEHHFMIVKDDGVQNRIDMFTRKDTLYCQVVLSGTTYGVKLNQTIGQGMKEWSIYWHSNTVYFYVNGALKHSESLYNRGAAGRFETVVRAKYRTGDYASVNDMKIDSVMAFYQTQTPPLINISSSSSSNNPATAYLIYDVQNASKVWIYMERWCWGCNFNGLRESLIYVTESDSISPGSQNVSYVFDGALESGSYRWMVKAENLDSGVRDSVYSPGFYFNTTNNTVLSAVKDQVGQTGNLPKVFSLSQNRPNPFNPSTTISYSVPEGSRHPVSISVFNLRGQRIKVLIDAENKAPGFYSVFWDGRDAHGKPAPSGVYFYRLESGDYVSIRKMIILK